jgi:hypothetical protein
MHPGADQTVFSPVMLVRCRRCEYFGEIEGGPALPGGIGLLYLMTIRIVENLLSERGV